MSMPLKFFSIAFSVILAFFTGFSGKMTEAAADVYVTWGSTQCDDRTIELGECLRLPYEYGNYSGAGQVTFTVTMNSNNLFGPEHVVHQELIPDGYTKRYIDGGPVVCTEYSTPLESDTIVMKVTTSATGDEVIEECSFKLTLSLPSDLSDLIQVPCRWCVLEGSPLSEGKKPGELVSGDKLFSLLQKASDETWTPNAHIAFRSALGDGIPVVADTTVEFCEKGCLEYPAYEAKTPVTECEKEWADMDPSAKGIILLNTGVLWPNIEGFTPDITNGLYVNGQRGDDLCGHPRNLLVSDVTDKYVVVGDQGLYGKYYNGDPARTLAHELGHALLLGHGDGLDNNTDGLEPPNLGKRRYDQFCDPLGNQDDFPIEDATTTYKSLMDYSASWDLTELQIEQARAAAKLMPGASYDQVVDPAGAFVADTSLCAPPCDLPEDVFLLKVEVAQTPYRQLTEISHTVFGPIPSDVNNHYFAFVDLDDNENTGCAPSILGLPTGFVGAELVSRVAVDQTGNTSTVWTCQSGILVESTNPNIYSNAFNQIDDEENYELFGIISIQIPDSVVGSVANQLRIQALAMQLVGEGKFDRLPKNQEDGGLISLIPQNYPQCSLSPPVVNPGAITTVTASGLVANKIAEVYIGSQLLGTSSTDSNGNLELDINIPSNSQQGVRPITVRIKDTLYTAVAAVRVEGNALTPATSITLLPSPNGGGWNNSDVEVSLTATDIIDGGGIKEITYNASGAHDIPTTKIPGNYAAFNITTQGETVVTYYSTNISNNIEAPQSIAVSLDKTKPVITSSRLPAPNAYGWNNTGVTVSATCQDALSGILSCPPPAVFNSEGANQVVNLEAVDLAFNSATASVSGINIDMTQPIVSYSGNEETYNVSQMINITCDATDSLSGIASTNCQDIIGQGYTYQLGPNTFSASATDKAGNNGIGSTTFTVIVTYDSLSTLTRQFVSKAGVEKALLKILQAAQDAEIRGDIDAKTGQIQAYINTILAQAGKSLSTSDANILVKLAGEL